MTNEVERYVVDVDEAPTSAVDLGRLAALAFAHRVIAAAVAGHGRHTIAIREQVTGELRAAWERNDLGWRLTTSAAEWLS